MSTITKIQEAAIAEYLNTHPIPVGLGNAEAACSIAAINLALTGRLTDEIPDCMSLVIGHWIIKVQDAMPSEMRNSVEYKALLPLAAGTGRNRNHEKARLALILDWMGEEVLPQAQPMADEAGFGEAWAVMCREKTPESAEAAADAARGYAATATYAAATATYAARAAANAAAYADAAAAAARVARACACAACAACAAAAADFMGNTDAFWAKANPVKLLAALIAVA